MNSLLVSMIDINRWVKQPSSTVAYRLLTMPQIMYLTLYYTLLSNGLLRAIFYWCISHLQLLDGGWMSVRPSVLPASGGHWLNILIQMLQLNDSLSEDCQHVHEVVVSDDIHQQTASAAPQNYSNCYCLLATNQYHWTDTTNCVVHH